MPTPIATDDFTTGTDLLLEAYSASWTNKGPDDFGVSEAQDAVLPLSSSNESMAHWNADSFDDDQYATYTMVVAGTGGGGFGVAVRVTGTGGEGYGFYGDSANFSGGSPKNYLFYLESDMTWNQIADTAEAGFDVDDVIRLEVEGTLLTPTINGSTTNTPGAQTDTTYSSGKPGLSAWLGTAQAQYADDWEGGNMADPPAGARAPFKILRPKQAQVPIHQYQL